MSRTTNMFPPEVGECAVRMALDNPSQHGSRWQAIASVSAKIGCSAVPLNNWVKTAEVDNGQRAGTPTDMAEKTKPLSAIDLKTMARALERKNRVCPIFCVSGV